MKNRINIQVVGTAIVLAGVVLFTAGFAHALSLGAQITINDGIPTVAPGTPLKEDNECEPGMVQSQVWDLEGFYLNGTILSIVGGYNFYTGQTDGKKILKAGDIFIDTNIINAIYSPDSAPGITTPYQTIANSVFQYDYVLDVDWANGTYNVVKLTDDSLLMIGEYGSKYNTPSNPWQYVANSGGMAVAGFQGKTFEDYGENYFLTRDPDLQGLMGWNGNDKHYVASFDLSFLQSNTDVLFHNTMECGNDNLLGRGMTPVPEPGTILLLGSGLLGLGLLRRRRKS